MERLPFWHSGVEIFRLAQFFLISNPTRSSTFALARACNDAKLNDCLIDIDNVEEMYGV